MIYATRLASEVGSRSSGSGRSCRSRVTGTPVVVQEFVAGARASDVWPALAEAQRCHLAREFGAVVGRLFGAQP